MSEQLEWEDIEDEYRRLQDFHGNMERLYHAVIGRHESTISIHAVGDLLLKAGTLKEVEVIS